MLDELRQNKNLIVNRDDKKVWRIVKDKYWIVSFSQHLGPRYISATVKLQYEISKENLNGNNVIVKNSLIDDDKDYIRHSKYTKDDEVISFFMEGLVAEIQKCSKSISIEVTGLIFEDVESSIMSFKILGNIVGRLLIKEIQ